MFTEIINKKYSYIFIRLEIALSKKFKQNILNCYFFTKCLYLLAVNKIHLVEKQNKDFWPMYAKIEKV